jgi:transcriptional regulator with XRE-family HTH domain
VLDFPTDRYLRAARRLADLSQREFAEKTGLTQSVVARAEHSPHLARVDQFARLLETAGLRLLVVDDEGREFAPEGEDAANRRDRGYRRYPAHVDVRPGTDGWWGDGWPMFFGKRPQYTFDRVRWRRDMEREWAKRQDTAADSEQSNADGANRE